MTTTVCVELDPGTYMGYIRLPFSKPGVTEVVSEQC
jgi:hypothetical protein